MTGNALVKIGLGAKLSVMKNPQNSCKCKQQGGGSIPDPRCGKELLDLREAVPKKGNMIMPLSVLDKC